MTEIFENDESDTPSPPDGAVTQDWEAIFESPENGFIPVVKQARTISGLHESTLLIINGLFTRENDTAVKTTYEQTLEQLLPTTGTDDPPLDKAIARIVLLLREIKEYRLVKAAEYEEKIRQEASAEEKRNSTEPDTLPGLEDVQPLDEEQVIEGIFADIFIEHMLSRLRVLNKDIDKRAANAELPPFILSEDFTAHFEGILKSVFVPVFLIQCRPLLHRAANQPEEARQKYLHEQFTGRVNARNLWDRWQDIWIDHIRSKPLPKKPKDQKKATLFGFLKAKKSPGPAWKQELTPEEWKLRTKEIKAANEQARELWKSIAVPSETYQAPLEEDEHILMELFARSAKGLQKNIDALHQIADQEDDPGRSLSTYLHGKNIDLPVLAVCYQSPDQFLGSQKCYLKKMLFGKDDTEIAGILPLVSRYLKAYR